MVCSIGRAGELPQLFHEMVEVDRLGDELGRAEGLRPAPVPFVVAIGGHHHHRQIGKRCLIFPSSVSPSIPGILMSDKTASNPVL